jgi:hypothetical protein
MIISNNINLNFYLKNFSYPLKNLTSFSSSLEQYKQSIHAFDGLEANAAINEFVQYERLADRPAWVFFFAI